MARKSRANEAAKYRTFKLNKGLKNEKILKWSHKAGFESEDSENEQTNFDRFERQLYERRREKYGNEAVYLQRRRILPFERLLMALGGTEIFEDVLAKTVVLTGESMVYAWQDTEQAIDFRLDNFLTVEDEQVFQQRYSKERNMQYEALGGDSEREETSIFCHELEQIWQCVSYLLKQVLDPNSAIFQSLMDS